MSLEFELRKQIGDNEPIIIITGSRNYIIEERRKYLANMSEEERTNKNIRIWMTGTPAKKNNNNEWTGKI